MNPPDVRGGNRTTVDFTLKNPTEISIANCVSARTDRGISIRNKEGSGVFELSENTKGGNDRKSNFG